MAILFPAIDLLGGKAVRLTKGEKKSAKEYGNALDFAKYFEDCGAKWLHIVDLDGAFEGSPKNLSVIECFYFTHIYPTMSSNIAIFRIYA